MNESSVPERCDYEPVVKTVVQHLRALDCLVHDVTLPSPASDASILAVEWELDFALPEELRAFYRQYGGGLDIRWEGSDPKHSIGGFGEGFYALDRLDGYHTELWLECVEEDRAYLTEQDPGEEFARYNETRVMQVPLLGDQYPYVNMDCNPDTYGRCIVGYPRWDGSFLYAGDTDWEKVRVPDTDLLALGFWEFFTGWASVCFQMPECGDWSFQRGDTEKVDWRSEKDFDQSFSLPELASI